LSASGGLRIVNHRQYQFLQNIINKEHTTMLRSVIYSVSVIVMLLAAVALAAPPLVLSHQGRLLDAADHPVNGSVTLIYSIYDSPIGGNPLWTEDHPSVTISDGLFTVGLGRTVPFPTGLFSSGSSSGGALYLQIQVTGELPLMPRLPLSSAPFSIASSSVSGDVHTSPGTLELATSDSSTTIELGATETAGKKAAKFKAGAELAGTVNKRSVSFTADQNQGAIAIDEADFQRFAVLSTGGSSDGTGGEVRLRLRTCCLGSSGEDGVSFLATSDSSSVVVGDPNGASCVSSVTNLGGGASAAAYAATGRVRPPGVDQVLTAVDDAGTRIVVDHEGTQRVQIGASSGSGTPLASISLNGLPPGEPIIRKSILLQTGGSSSSIAIDEPGVHITQSVSPDSTVFDQGADATSRVMIHKIHAGGDLRMMRQLLTDDSTVSEQSADFGSSKIVHRDLAARNVLLSSSECVAGPSSSSVSQTCDTGGVAISLRKIDSTPARISTNFTVGKQGSRMMMDYDSDGDGVPENSEFHAVAPTGTHHTLNSKGTGAQNGRVVSVSSSTSPDSAVSVCSLDLDGDGHVDRNMRTRINELEALTATELDRNDDGIPDVGVSSEAKVSRSILKTFFQSGDTPTQSRVVCTADASGASSITAADLDGDGSPEGELALSVGIGATAVKGTFTVPGRAHPNTTTGTSSTESAAACRVAADSDDDGVDDNDVAMTVTPTTSSVAIKTKGTGADKDRVSSVSSSTDDFGAGTVCAVDLDGDGVAEQSLQQSVSGSAVIIALAGKKGYDYYQARSDMGASLVMRDSLKDTTIVVDGDGRIGIGRSVDATKRIVVAGGAYCDGSNWVNASDANLKENFADVDGNELLNKIASLPISEWNYKAGADRTKHIGPTAQDFQATFGVGSDGKSISTIDPSGIALAAIKELNKKLNERNASLEEKNAELSARLEKLQQMVEKLATQNANQAK
jgi:hypothetical protein